MSEEREREGYGRVGRGRVRRVCQRREKGRGRVGRGRDLLVLRLDLTFTYDEGSKGRRDIRDGEQDEGGHKIHLVVSDDGRFVDSERQGMEGHRDRTGRGGWGGDKARLKMRQASRNRLSCVTSESCLNTERWV